MARVSVTRFRPELARWIAHVQSPEEFVILTAHGREVAALVSIRNLDLIWDGLDERRIGPINPATGRPFGRAWVLERFQGHYERGRDPDAHLHPSREDAPWLGRPFDWPPVEAPDAPQDTTSSAPPRPWWRRFWPR